MDAQVKAQMTMTEYLDVVDEIGPDFAQQSQDLAETDDFVFENVEVLKKHRFYSAMVPDELGGGGVAYSEMCRIIRRLAYYCPSTALTFSMHQHLIAANRYNYHHANPGQALLEKVVAKELVLVSTGANDWLASSGTMTKTDGGYLVTAKKTFASGSIVGEMFLTSAQYEDPEDGWQVLHFPILAKADGVSVADDWQAMGMRQTGSHTAIFENVFVAEESIGARRPRGEFHPMWNVVLTVAMPLIMTAYVGVAEAAADIVRRGAPKRQGDPHLPYLMGEMENALMTAQVVCDSMVDITNDFEFEPVTGNANDILKRKTVVADAVIKTTTKAIEASGGFGYLRKSRLEQLFRDAHASQFHPLAEKKQLHFTGRMAMGLVRSKRREICKIRLCPSPTRMSISYGGWERV